VPGLLRTIDCALGDRITESVTNHHVRRLERLGSKVLEAPPGGWAADASPPRQGNRLEVLIDGEAALQRMTEDLQAAVSHVRMTGWYLSPDFVMVEGDRPVVVRDLLADTATRADLRLLLWAGAPAPVFTPSRKQVRGVRDELRKAGITQVALDSHERPMHCHHEKTMVIDDRVAYVGGIDLTALAGDRRDSSRHPARAAVGWHDAAVRIEGPAVADVAEHFAMRWSEVTGRPAERPPEIAPAGDLEAQVVTTCPEKVYGAVPRGAFGILESYLRAIRSAEQLVYLESQYLWSPEIVATLADKVANPPSDRFRLVVLLPARPYGGADDTRGALGELVDADDGQGRVLGCCLAARAGAVADPVYVHAKIGIVDDRWLTIGSANLNDHSLFNDTEMNVVCHDPGLARHTRLRLWAEHLECDPADIDGDPTDVIDDRLRPIAEEQLARRRAGRPLTHRLVRLDHVSRRFERLLGPLQGLLVDG
jgi:phosphatidylserine/phosphatidylglycerophosphate/cardiolipin synthase-like enzyme